MDFEILTLCWRKLQVKKSSAEIQRFFLALWEPNVVGGRHQASYLYSPRTYAFVHDEQGIPFAFDFPPRVANTGTLADVDVWVLPHGCFHLALQWSFSSFLPQFFFVLQIVRGMQCCARGHVVVTQANVSSHCCSEHDDRCAACARAGLQSLPIAAGISTLVHATVLIVSSFLE